MWPKVPFNGIARKLFLCANGYHRHSSRYSGMIEKRIEGIAKAEVVTDDPVVLESYSMQASALVGQLKTLRKSIKKPR
ncbi:MAG: hypothetical protein ABFR33_02865 [Verrucomicrobiota bacterium]